MAAIAEQGQPEATLCTGEVAHRLEGPPQGELGVGAIEAGHHAEQVARRSVRVTVRERHARAEIVDVRIPRRNASEEIQRFACSIEETEIDPGLRLVHAQHGGLGKTLGGLAQGLCRGLLPAVEDPHAGQQVAGTRRIGERDHAQQRFLGRAGASRGQLRLGEHREEGRLPGGQREPFSDQLDRLLDPPRELKALGECAAQFRVQGIGGHKATETRDPRVRVTVGDLDPRGEYRQLLLPLLGAGAVNRLRHGSPGVVDATLLQQGGDPRQARLGGVGVSRLRLDEQREPRIEVTGVEFDPGPQQQRSEVELGTGLHGLEDAARTREVPHDEDPTRQPDAQIVPRRMARQRCLEDPDRMGGLSRPHHQGAEGEYLLRGLRRDRAQFREGLPETRDVLPCQSLLNGVAGRVQSTLIAPTSRQGHPQQEAAQDAARRRDGAVTTAGRGHRDPPWTTPARGPRLPA